MFEQKALKMKQTLRRLVHRSDGWRRLVNRRQTNDNGYELESEANPLSETIIPADREQRHLEDQGPSEEQRPPEDQGPSEEQRPLVDQGPSEEQRPPEDPGTVLQNLLHVLYLPPPAEGGTASPPWIHTQAISLMQMFWHEQFQMFHQNLEQNLDQNLQAHLKNLLEAVFPQVERLSPRLEPLGLMGDLCDCCHRQTFDHLQTLLQSVQSRSSYYVLMNWARHSYMRHEMLSSPDAGILNEWETKAEGKLLENVQKDIKSQIENILKHNQTQKHCVTEEDYVELSVDVIQCVDFMPKEAKQKYPDVYSRVAAICFQELFSFVNKYAAQQKEVLKTKAKMDKLETIHFLKTLKTCKEIRKYIENTKREDVLKALVTLRELEHLTLTLLTGAVAHVMEHNMKKYFRSHSRRFFQFKALEECFPQKPYVQDEHKTVMEEIYKVTAHIYFKHLIRHSVKSLKRCWNEDVGGTVSADAEALHELISQRAPGVYPRNKLLELVPEVLTIQSIDMLKLTMAIIQNDCQPDDRRLLPDLLRWKGLGKKDVRAVMEALPDSRPPPPPCRALRFCCCCC